MSASERANSGIVRKMTSLIARLTFYPTVGWTMMMEKLSGRRWYDRVDDTVIVGAIPSVGMIPELVEKEGVRGVVSMNEDFELKMFAKEMDWAQAGVKFLQLPTVDLFGVPSKAQLERGLAFIADVEQLKGSVYVHCKAGRVRSATLVGYYLMSKYNLSPEDAASTIREKRSHILITSKSLSLFRPDTVTPSSTPSSASTSTSS